MGNDFVSLAFSKRQHRKILARDYTKAEYQRDIGNNSSRNSRKQRDCYMLSPYTKGHIDARREQYGKYRDCKWFYKDPHNRKHACMRQAFVKIPQIHGRHDKITQKGTDWRTVYTDTRHTNQKIGKNDLDKRPNHGRHNRFFRSLIGLQNRVCRRNHAREKYRYSQYG